METKVKVIGGPGNGSELGIKGPLPSEIHFYLTEDFKPAAENDRFVLARYDLKHTPAPTYAFRNVERLDGQPFEIEYVGGPQNVVKKSKFPIQGMRREESLPIGTDGNLYNETTEIGVVS